MENEKLNETDLDKIKNHINNLPKEAKEELKNKGFDINNEQHLQDLAQVINFLNDYQRGNLSHELSMEDLDSVSGGLLGITTPIEAFYHFEKKAYNNNGEGAKGVLVATLESPVNAVASLGVAPIDNIARLISGGKSGLLDD